jgi:hypothetical protein
MLHIGERVEYLLDWSRNHSGNSDRCHDFSLFPLMATGIGRRRVRSQALVPGERLSAAPRATKSMQTFSVSDPGAIHAPIAQAMGQQARTTLDRPRVRKNPRPCEKIRSAGRPIW